MNEIYFWAYEYAPGWNSSQWEWAILIVALISVVLHFVYMRTKNKRVGQITIGIDFLDSILRSLRNRARKREMDRKNED